MAVEHAGNDKVKAAFVEHAEHSDITDDNKDALLLLCACLGLASRVRAVLQAGANAAHINQAPSRFGFFSAASYFEAKRGKTSLTVAMEHKHDAAAELLVQPTIDAGMDIDAQDSTGKTVLMRACADGLTNTAAKLVSLGANPELKDTVEAGVCVSHCVLKD